MRKVVLGVSVYPQHIEFNEIKKYLITAKKYGFTKIFTSLFYLDQPSVNINLPKYLRLFKLAKQLGFYIIADIGPSVIRMLKDDNHFSKLKLFQIDCLRLDTPLLPSVVADATYQGVDIQINASNDTKFIDDVISLKANISRISVLHNFYPKNQTGLG
jgi:hypothetical protein